MKEKADATVRKIARKCFYQSRNQIKWFKKDDLLKELKHNPNNFLRSIKDCIDLFNK